jgi:hypothetical protein
MAKVNSTLHRDERLTDNLKYRSYMQDHGESIRSYNMSVAQTEVSAHFPNTTFGYVVGPPHLYLSPTAPQAPKYETSDLKDWYLQKYGI